MRGKQFQLSFIVLFLFFIVGTSLCLGKESSFTLIYTSNNLGEVEPCLTCPEAGENGGLPRRSHFIKTARKEAKDLLILDAGDALVIDYFSRASEREKGRR
jgi:2',3'-cyclic-nucleotide 2'-phosphodiesterase (5'-nucleotidase family)